GAPAPRGPRRDPDGDPGPGRPRRPALRRRDRDDPPGAPVMQATQVFPREWARPGLQWQSEAVREAWRPVLHRAQRAWLEAEIASVGDAVRAAALVTLEPAEIPQAARDCAYQGLEMSVLQAQPDGTYRAAVHHRGHAAAWHRAWS